MVIDASIDNITIINNLGDTLNISTMDSDPANVPGVLVNDSVEITLCYREACGKPKRFESNKACCHTPFPYFYIAGTWIQPNPIKAKEVQGFTLNQGGTAFSVNMATLILKIDL